jgi:7,8-dihydro-6-hydroxymethylpterin-pyrophosphokinase
VLDTDGLVLPDPDITSRSFLAACLSELSPDLILPGTTSRIGDLSARFSKDTMHPLEDYTAQIKSDLYFFGRS